MQYFKMYGNTANDIFIFKHTYINSNSLKWHSGYLCYIQIHWIYFFAFQHLRKSQLFFNHLPVLSKVNPTCITKHWNTLYYMLTVSLSLFSFLSLFLITLLIKSASEIIGHLTLDICWCKHTLYVWVENWKEHHCDP